MPTNKILDSDFFSGWKHYVNDPDEIFWESKPKREFTFSLLLKDFGYDVMSGVVSFFGIGLAISIYICYNLFASGNIILGIIAVKMAFIFFFGIDIYEYYGQSITRYAVTEKWVLFQLLNWGKLKIYAVPTNSLYKLSVEEYEDKSGTIHFVTDYPGAPKTVKLQDGKARFYPTFEGVEEVVSVYNKIKHIAPKKGKTVSYLPKNPVIPEIEMLPKIRRAQNYIIAFCLLFAVDFYLLPTFTIQDNGISQDRTLFESELYANKDIGGTYQTESGLSYGTYDFYYPELGESELTISYTPIFKSVKSVKSATNDYTYNLGSDLNGFGRYFYYIAFIIIAGGRVTLMKANKPDKDTIWKVILSSAIFTALGGFVWIMYNGF